MTSWKKSSRLPVQDERSPRGRTGSVMAKKHRSYEPARRRASVRLETVRIVVDQDTDPDPSYLDQEEFEDRRREYERGDFGFVFVRAEADVVIGDLVQTLRSGGLYGIESDSDESYISEVAAEEWSSLRDVLKAVGVPTSELPVEVDPTWVEWRM